MNISRWSVLNADQTRKLACVRITSSKSPRTLADAAACEGTLYDARMGPRYDGDTCGTCGKGFRECKLGHYGVIELTTHVFINKFIPHIIRAIRRVCKTCGKEASKASCAATREACVPYSFVKNERNGTLLVDKTDVWTASDTFRILQRAWLADHPEHMVFENMLVLSNPQRPAHVDTTDPRRAVVRVHRYNEGYVKILGLVKKREQMRDVERRMFSDAEIYEAVNALLMSGAPGRAGTTQVAAREEDTTGILSGLTRKRGLIRNNLMGKRVDFSARGVAVGNPTLRVDEFGIPRAWRNRLTIPVRVHKHNAEKMHALVCSGEWTTIIKKGMQLSYDSKSTPVVRYKQIADRLVLGDVVERFLCDGDHVMLIRQPTLHKGSMMCGKARLHDRHTVEMNVNVTTPFNGDFDGDEFNVFVAQEETARAEFEELFAVKHHIVNENGQCQIYLIQNAVLGAYRMTLENPDCLPRIGRGIATEAACRERIRQIWFDESHEAAVEAIQEVSDLANEWIRVHGASLGLNELDMLPSDAEDDPSDGSILRETKRKLREVRANLLNADGYDSGRAFNEAAVFLNTQIQPYDTALRDMRASGCKGKTTNELNFCLALGQQSVCDAAPKMFFGGTHILPCGLKTGFIPVGYTQGLRPEHTVVHQMAGRYDVYTKSVGVKVTGKRYRDMAQCMENLIVSATGSVLDERGRVVQLMYGEDGLDPKYVRPTGLPAHPIEWYPSEEQEEPVPDTIRNMSEKSKAYFAGRKTVPKKCLRDWMRAAAQYGHAVGIISAQSIGEPATQETLNKIHSRDAGSNRRESNMNRLFQPGRDGEITGETTDVPIPAHVSSWRVQKSRPADTDWTRRYESYDSSFSNVSSPSAYLIIEIDRNTHDLVGFLRKLPNRRSMHPALNTGPTLEVHVALPLGMSAEEVIAQVTPNRNSSTGFDWAKHAKSVRMLDASTVLCKSDHFAHILVQPWIRNAYSDDAKAVEKVLGIEAARAMLLREFMRIFKGKVDVRHVMLMIDAMTYTGVTTPMTNSGFRQSGASSVMGEACFGDALNTFVGAAARGHIEPSRKQNMSEAVVTGSACPLGTGDVHLMLDVDALFDAQDEDAKPDPVTYEDALRSATFDSPAFAPPVPFARPIPFSPVFQADEGDSPAYSPSSPAYSPSSPAYEPSSPAYDPLSEEYEPSSPAYDPMSEEYEPVYASTYEPPTKRPRRE